MTQPTTQSGTAYADKIAKLLAKAEGTSNPAEAEAFSEAAQRLMIKWSVDEATVLAAKGADVKPEDIIKIKHEFTGIYHYGFFKIAKDVADGLGNLKPFIVKYPKSTFLVLVGHERDVQRAMIMIKSMIVQAESAMRTWWKSSPEKSILSGMDAFKARRQFFFSFGTGVADTLMKIRREEAPVAGSGTDLVLVDRGAKVEQWIRESMNVGKVQRSRVHGGTDGAAQHGYRAGQRAAESNTSAPAVNR